MKAKCLLAVLAAFVLLFSVSAAQAQGAQATAPGVKVDVAILVRTTAHWDKRAGAGAIPPIVKNTEAYLKYKGITIGNKDNSRFWLTLVLDSAIAHGTIVIMSLSEAAGGSLWQSDKLTGEAIPMQAFFDTTPNPVSMDTLYSRMHAALDAHIDSIAMYRPAEDAPAPVAEKEAPAPAADAPATDLPRLSITSLPVSADIEIDGNFMGNAPAEIGLAAGDHVIVVSKKGYEPWQRKMKLAPGTTSLNVELDKKAQ
ncbi:MAG TPA: PEGA domain-containing protein [Candidatus Dormibacteraeota bacterium]|nr:PEGA domain-containing protein [Candidatus Dormibacteraeota bacterium]